MSGSRSMSSRRPSASTSVMRACPARRVPGEVVDVVLDVGEQLGRGVLRARDLRGRRVDRQHRTVGVPAVPVGVLEHAVVRAAVVPVQRRPEEERLGRARWGGAPGRDRGCRRLARPSCGPWCRRRASGRSGPSCRRSGSRPPSLPNCVKRVTSMTRRRPCERIWWPSSMHAVRAVNVRSAAMPVSFSSMVTRSGFIGSSDLDRERSDLQVGRLLRRAPRRVEGVLLAVAHDAQKPQSRMPRFGYSAAPTPK